MPLADDGQAFGYDFAPLSNDGEAFGNDSRPLGGDGLVFGYDFAPPRHLGSGSPPLADGGQAFGYDFAPLGIDGEAFGNHTQHPTGPSHRLNRSWTLACRRCHTPARPGDGEAGRSSQLTTILPLNRARVKRPIFHLPGISQLKCYSHLRGYNGI